MALAGTDTSKPAGNVSDGSRCDGENEDVEAGECVCSLDPVLTEGPWDRQSGAEAEPQ